MSGSVVLGFGGCQLHGPLGTLGSRTKVDLVFRKMGFGKTPFAFTPRAAMQLLAFCRGDLRIPPLVRRLCWAGAELEPDKDACSIPDTADIVLMEPNTPVDIVYRGFALSQQEIKRYIEDEAETRYPELARPVRRWKREGIYKGNEDARRAAAEQILSVFKPQNEIDEVMVDVLREAKGHVANLEEIRQSVADLRDSVSGRLALVLYTMQYMPDGRPISWPADFKDNVIAVARDLDLPVYEPAHLIAERGVTIALKDFRHYHDEFKPIAGDEMMIFLDRVANGAAYAPITDPNRPHLALPTPAAALPADTAAAPIAKPNDPQTILALAQQHVRESRFGDALAVTGSLLSGAFRLDAQKIRSLAAFKLGRLEEAEAAYRDVLRAQPDDARSYDNLARILVQTGRSDEAIRMLNDAIGLVPHAISLHKHRAALLFAAGRMEEARRAVDIGLGIDPGEERLNSLRARIGQTSVKAA